MTPTERQAHAETLKKEVQRLRDENRGALALSSSWRGKKARIIAALEAGVTALLDEQKTDGTSSLHQLREANVQMRGFLAEGAAECATGPTAIYGFNEPAFAVCRCGHWDTAHDRETGKCPVPNPESFWRFYEFRRELPSGLPHPSLPLVAVSRPSEPVRETLDPIPYWGLPLATMLDWGHAYDNAIMWTTPNPVPPVSPAPAASVPSDARERIIKAASVGYFGGVHKSLAKDYIAAAREALLIAKERGTLLKYPLDMWAVVRDLLAELSDGNQLATAKHAETTVGASAPSSSSSSTQAARVSPAQEASAHRTLVSIATMLDWGNLPPRETLEREISTLKSLAKEASMLRSPSPTWRPIATAPKDGTVILGFVPNLRVVACWWDPEFEHVYTDATPDEPTPRGAWTDNAVQSFGMEEVKEYEPTHWMPLPEGPTDPPSSAGQE